ncbi:hypothetical protein MMC25_003391 [Agyrium rufum]|nr:hypothetical protein [Agyrium rufum]
MDIQLYVYDLSKVLLEVTRLRSSKIFSSQFLGTQIDAVYHTSLVFGGIEYFFGAGVQTCYPGATHHGQPMQVIPMGKTGLDMDVILEYLESLKEVYTAEAYDLFMHNCNNFTNDFSMFLVGKGIPSHITSLPQTVLNTPFGQMLRPQLDRAMRDITQAPVPGPAAAAPKSSSSNGMHAQARSSAASTRNGINGVNSTRSNVTHEIEVGKVHNITSLVALDKLLAQASQSCAVIFFTSSTCAPCKMCYPAYDQLAAEAGNKAILIKVDLNHSTEIRNCYPVRGTPTFMTFLRGEKQDEWSGANPARLLGDVRLLVEMAHPPHPHRNLRLDTLQRPQLRFVTYTKVPPIEKLIAKLGPSGSDPSVIALKDFINARTKEEAASAPLPSLSAIGAVIRSSLKSLPPTTLFPLIDLFRLALIDPRVSGFFAEESQHETIFAVLTHILDLSAKDECPYSLRIVTLQMCCNLFTSSLYPPQLVGDPALASPVISLVSSSLLDAEHAPVRVSAASLAFNLAAMNHRSRLEDKGEVLDEGLQVELVAGLLEAMGRDGEDSKEALKGMVLALGLLAYECPKDGEVKDLLSAMDAKGVLKGKKEVLSADKTLLAEVLQVVS